MHRFNRQHPLPINVFSPALSLSLLLSARLCPPSPNTLTDPCIRWALKTNYVFPKVYRIYNLWEKGENRNTNIRIFDAFCRFSRATYTFPCALSLSLSVYAHPTGFLCKLLVWKIKVYRRFPWLFVSASERAQKVRRNCKRVDTQSDRRAFVWERKMIYCHWGGSNRVHGELWWRRGGAKLWSCWASIS